MLKSKVIVILVEALKLRDHCPQCNGQGFNYNYVQITEDEGEAEPEGCECSVMVANILEKLDREIESAKFLTLAAEGVSRTNQFKNKSVDAWIDELDVLSEFL